MLLKKFASKIQDIIWPIKSEENQFFFPLALLMLCVLFNFGALRSMKDSLIVPAIGAEAISFLKLWLVLPSTILFTLIYIKLSNFLSHQQLFTYMIGAFLSIFVIFSYILYPNQELYHLSDATITKWIEYAPNLQWFIKIIAKWSFALMYVFCELWSVVIINLLFWQYANSIFDTSSAKRFYPILGLIGNIGLILAGNMLVLFADLSGVDDISLKEFYLNDINYQCNNVLKPITNCIIVAGVIAILIYRYINIFVLPKLHLNHKANNKTTKEITKEKTKLSFKESIKLVLNSKYIGHIALLVFCYGITINILEGPWKAKVKTMYPNMIDYMNFMGKFNIYMGTSCVLFTIISSNILRRVNWYRAALVTPYMLLITGSCFFLFVAMSYYYSDELPFAFNPIYYAVIIGAAQNILSKSTKYSLFDSTKEMAYIPLSMELRTKGKAAVEVIGLKFGKSLGAFSQFIVFSIFTNASFDSIALYLFFIFLVIIAVWFWNIKEFNKEYQKINPN